MNYDNSTVVVSITLPGQQASHGRYSHFNKVNHEGKPIEGVKMDRTPAFCESHKTITLGESFVQGALNEPPVELRKRYRLSYWQGLTEQKRIVLSVDKLVKAIHPEYRSYTVEVI